MFFFEQRPSRVAREKPRFDAIEALAFDHYGTLFDKHAISELIEAEFPGRGQEVAESWYVTTKEYCWLNGMMERHQTWDDLTKRALAYVCKVRGIELAPDLHDRLIQADLMLPPFPEVPAALERLAAKFDLFVLSMGSPWMIEASQKNAGVSQWFKKIISVEPYKVYKPSAKAYDIGTREIGLPKERIGFVSSNSFDVMGSANYGFPTFWMNRTGGPLDTLGPTPNLVVGDLAELAEVLGV
ncbi:MAG: haloacid dehalogenase type II [Proteobacteria bacterium]|nr:haloacid dehalogenase type II [Pseudomonadota bacterium]MCH9011473.1 haloacid dehalogenase type II [Pseudomonadota bacterium]